ncbi:hypothetical protein GCM10010910_22220 [Microbacterium nanhaiense]|uniref:SbsA Ig-like domain-containing protein n=1 Tax=Microbacterium nanhaiense TaxID=1301026 RepID=A0ABQ2N3J3_9MICO|nr:Ig-like domain-containing protein [Microbacterium nanhaiense]GGO65326.1 hypothetical protein GCM10010910_22220 [Microbacterium nanhaiense]
MSTDSRRGQRIARGRGRFARGLAITLGALAVVGGAAAASSLAQGPRATQIQQDPEAAVAQSGSRVIFTANESLAEIDEADVTVEPATDFTLDAAGRTVGVRFPTALDADTTYTVTIDGVRGLGGGPASTLTTSFTTPKARVLMLERDAAGDDRIVSRTVGADTDDTVFSAAQIDDFRATSAYLIATTVDGGVMHVTVIDRASGATHEIPLPGPGTVTGLQVSERGQLYGFTFTDANLSAAGGRENVLFTGSLASADAPVPVVVGGSEPSIDRWRFVPETSSLLLNSFDGDLTLVDRQNPDGEVSSFGTALGIEGVARSTYTALIDRFEEGFVELDLATGEQRVLSEVQFDRDALLGHIQPLPSGDTLRSYAMLEDGIPTTSRIVIASPEGDAREIAATRDTDVLQQVCASPSAQYIALIVSDATGPAYDGGVQSLPERIETRIYDGDTGDEVATWPGFDISWCEVGPW